MSAPSEDILERAKRIRLAAFDVDGTLTDGRLWFDGDGRESKAYHIHDGLGLKLIEALTRANDLESSPRIYTVAWYFHIPAGATTTAVAESFKSRTDSRRRQRARPSFVSGERGRGRRMRRGRAEDYRTPT